MDALSEQLRSDTDAEQKIAAVKKFNEENEKRVDFVVGDNAETKQECISALLNFLAESSHPNSVPILCAIRLLCREEVGLEPLREIKNLQLLLEKTQLTTDFSDTTAIETGVEACKCFVNVCVQNIKNPNLYDEFLNTLEIPKHCTAALRNENLPDAFYFPLLRFYLQLCGRHQETLQYTTDQYLLPDLVRIIIKFSDRYEDTEARLTLLDAMSLTFIITQKLGPLEGPTDPVEEELKAFKRVIPYFQKFLALPKDKPIPLSIVSATVKCMINVPALCTDDFEHEKTLSDLLGFIIVQLEKPEEEIVAADLTPVLLILTSISKAIRASRVVIKDTLLPGWRDFEPTNNMIDPPEPLQDESTIGYKLLYCMTCSNPGLYHYSAELLFSVCDEDADEFVRVVGVGKGAGILANRGLLNSFSSRITRPSNQPRHDITEQDIEEWNRLMDRLEKHNQSHSQPK